MRCTTRDGVDVEILCFRFGIFVGFSLWLQGITLKTHDVTSLIRSQRLLSFFQVSCPISCSLFLYHRNFSYPHKHNVIQTAEVTTALGWPWDEHEHPPLPFPVWESPLPLPHSSAGSEQHLQEKWLFLLLQNWKSDSHSIYSSASVLPYQGGLGTAAAPQLQGHRGWVLAAAQGAGLHGEFLLHPWHRAPQPSPTCLSHPSLHAAAPQPAPSASQPLLPLPQPQLLSCSGS